MITETTQQTSVTGLLNKETEDSKHSKQQQTKETIKLPASMKPVAVKKKKKKKKSTAPVVFPSVGERVRDKVGTSTGTVRYIGTVHTSTKIEPCGNSRITPLYNGHCYNQSLAAFDQNLVQLNTTVVDMTLLHSPPCIPNSTWADPNCMWPPVAVHVQLQSTKYTEVKHNVQHAQLDATILQQDDPPRIAAVKLSNHQCQPTPLKHYTMRVLELFPV